VNNEIATVQISRVDICEGDNIVVSKVDHGVVATIGHLEYALRLIVLCFAQISLELVSAGNRREPIQLNHVGAFCIHDGVGTKAWRRNYSITSSANNKNDSGIVRPSPLAVFKFTTKLNFVGS
jgi:hypothetical protein